MIVEEISSLTGARADSGAGEGCRSRLLEGHGGRRLRLASRPPTSRGQAPRTCFRLRHRRPHKNDSFFMGPPNASIKLKTTMFLVLWVFLVSLKSLSFLLLLYSNIYIKIYKTKKLEIPKGGIKWGT